MCCDAESENRAEQRGDIWAESVCAGDRVVLRVDVDGGGGLTAVEIVKYAAKG